MKLKSMKEVTLNRKGYVEIKDIILPISTKGVVEQRKAMRKAKEDQNMPMKVEIANDQELSALKAFGYNVKTLKVSVHRIDQSSKEYKEYEDNLDKVSLFLPISVQVDLTHPIGDDPTLWEHLGLKSENDIIGLANWLSQLGMDEKDRTEVEKKINLIKDSHCKTYDEWDLAVGENG